MTAPTLVIGGENDTISPRSDQETLTARILDARLVIYPDAGHTFYYEVPGRLAADLVAFVEQEVT
jgi:pimeloyl-ACP methyl ester carboxylesterase